MNSYDRFLAKWENTPNTISGIDAAWWAWQERDAEQGERVMIDRDELIAAHDSLCGGDLKNAVLLLRQMLYATR